MTLSLGDVHGVAQPDLLFQVWMGSFHDLTQGVLEKVLRHSVRGQDCDLLLGCEVFDALRPF